ncbi:MAG TPA: sugar phosphate isomerase/epimerase family protein, partial [Candidatus Limnocylindria bacterium]|nr:sugar phosphate isomerase/epimerase family protein [Candidatus Limnocylindria bacterium]
HLDPRLDPDVPQAKRWLREFGQSLHSIHAPFRGFTPRPASDEDFLRWRMDLWHKTIDYCAELSCPIMVVHALNTREYRYTLPQAHVIRDSLAELCEHGARAGVMVALENIPGGKGPDDILCTLASQRALFPVEGLKYCLDIGHVPLNGSDLFAEADAAGADLVTLHIHNNDLTRDSHNLPDDGLIDWPGLRSHLRRNGYTGKFVLEVEGRGDQEQVLRDISALFD